MKYADTSRGKPFSKDPAVVNFEGRYLMYHSIPPYRDGREPDGWSIGIAESDDLTTWHKIGEIAGQPGTHEKNGICAPGARVMDGKIHLFYQTYGNGRNDAICHAISTDGINFKRNSTNPIFAPTGGWNAGRAIDADAIPHEGKLFLYFATRDPDMKIQMQGVATSPLDSNFSRGQWTQQCDEPILQPKFSWEKRCIEGAACCKHNGKLFMFYAGGYNNDPQQIGLAVSSDGIEWRRMSDKPILPNGQPGEWNSSESGHPYLFTDTDGQMYLFYQGNNDNGKTWYLSKKKVVWKDGFPQLIP
ncbi:family 43 glycosylhydrolase [bacterium]|nr:family 43 glycosylhydrolase [bacterium]